MERGGDPRARPRPGGGPVKPAGRSQGFPGTIHRGGGKRNPDHVPLSPQWQSSARAKVRLQAGVVRAPHRPYRRTSDGRCSCRADRRLQRRTNCPGHPNPIFGQQRPHSAGKPSGFCAAACPRMDRRSAQVTTRRAALDILGLQARAVAAR